MIHPTAIIGKNVEIAEDVSIGPYSIIEDQVKIASGTQIGPHCHFLGWTTVGENCKFHKGCVIGDAPQDYGYKGEESYVEIGNNTECREYVTINRGHREGHKTIVGDNCLLMIQSHVGHDCIIGNNVTLVNQVNCGGHVEIDDFTIIGGVTAIHQFVKVGSRAMIGASSYLSMDVLPYSLIGHRSKCSGINVIGLKRSGFDKKQIRDLKKVFKLLLFSSITRDQAIAQIQNDYPDRDEIKLILDFIKRSTRGILK